MINKGNENVYSDEEKKCDQLEHFERNNFDQLDFCKLIFGASIEFHLTLRCISFFVCISLILSFGMIENGDKEKSCNSHALIDR